MYVCRLAARDGCWTYTYIHTYIHTDEVLHGSGGWREVGKTRVFALDTYIHTYIHPYMEGHYLKIIWAM